MAGSEARLLQILYLRRVVGWRAGGKRVELINEVEWEEIKISCGSEQL